MFKKVLTITALACAVASIANAQAQAQVKKNPFTDPETKPTEKKSDVKSPEIDNPVLESKDPIVVPFTKLPSGHFLVKVKVNGEGPYQLIFDTGAPISIITNRVAKQTQLGGILSTIMSGGIPVENIRKFEVGSAVAGNCTAVVLNHPTVTAISSAFEKDYGKIDGIVGFPFFSKFATTVDYQKQEMKLVPNGYKPGEFMNDLQKHLIKASESSESSFVASSTAWGLAVDKKKKDVDAGVNLIKVFADSPADKAGLKVGDRLLTIDGRWTDTEVDTVRAASLVKPGKTVVVEIKREGEVKKLNITPATGQ